MKQTGFPFRRWIFRILAGLAVLIVCAFVALLLIFRESDRQTEEQYMQTLEAACAWRSVVIQGTVKNSSNGENIPAAEIHVQTRYGRPDFAETCLDNYYPPPEIRMTTDANGYFSDPEVPRVLMAEDILTVDVSASNCKPTSLTALASFEVFHDGNSFAFQLDCAE